MVAMRQPATSAPAPTIRSLWLGGQPVEYLVRRSARSRGLRVTIDPRAGLVVSVPPPTRRGWTHPEDRIEAFLRERATWVVRHLDAAGTGASAARARGGARDGGLVPYRGELHRIRVRPGACRGRRSTVERSRWRGGGRAGLSLAAGERRPLDRVLGAWLRERATDAIEHAVARSRRGLGVRPSKVDVRDPRSRWGSASRNGRLMFSWRLVLAPAGLPRDGRRPRAGAPARVRPRTRVLGARRRASPDAPRRPCLAPPQRARAPLGARGWPRPGPTGQSTADLVGRGRIELPQSKTRVLQTLGLTTCPTDPRGDPAAGVRPGAAGGG